MLSAIRKSDGKTVLAYFETKANAPFVCPDCGDEVALKSGRNRIDHFAHVDPLACLHALNETDEHRRCKMEIFEALQAEPDVEDVVLERRLETVRPDISAYVRGTPIAIEVQISSLSSRSSPTERFNITARAFMSFGFCPGRRSLRRTATACISGRNGCMPPILAGCIIGNLA